MRQRNTSGSPLDLPTLNPPVSVPPGGVIDFDQLLAGFEPVEADPQEGDGEATGDDVPVPGKPEPAADSDVDDPPADQAAVTSKTNRKGDN